MDRVITATQVATIIAASEALKGTTNYNRYYMCLERKCNGNWKFCGWFVPYVAEEKPIRKYRNKRYVMLDAETRYELTPEVEALIKQ